MKWDTLIGSNHEKGVHLKSYLLCHSLLKAGVHQVGFWNDLKGILCISCSPQWSTTLLCTSQHFGLHWQPKGSHTSKVYEQSMVQDWFILNLQKV